MSNTKDIRTIKEEVAREIIAARNDRPNFRQNELWWSWKQYCQPSAQEYEDALDKVTDRYTRHLRSRISELEAENQQLEIKVLDMQDDRSKLREAEHFIDLQKLTLRDLEAENKRLREEIETQQIEIVKKDEQIDNQRWIPVTERLPETSMWVLCICSEERHWLAFRALNGWYIDTSFGQKFIGDQDETKHIKIQHWQPLTFPQPPKEQ